MCCRPPVLLLDLTDQIDARFQCFATFFPFGGANFARMFGDELGSFYFTKQFVGDTADTVIIDFCQLNLPDLPGMYRGKPYRLLRSLLRMHGSIRLSGLPASGI